MSETNEHSSAHFKDFVDTLESFKELRTGISGSRIKKLTAYALENFADREESIAKIIEYSKTCPKTHKLGSLYIIDSIGRAFLNEAKLRDDYIKKNARKGSCAHSLFILGESMSELLNLALSDVSQDHKEKIKDLLEIWDRAGLFQKSTLNAIRSKYYSMDNSQHSMPSMNVNSNIPGILPSDPKERAQWIINNLKPIENMPRIDVPSSIFSQEENEQTIALKQLLTSLHKHLDEFSFNNTTVSHNAGNGFKDMYSSNSAQAAKHVTTEYDSRHDRERERYSSRRNRSRSPSSSRRNSHGQRGRHQPPHNNNGGSRYIASQMQPEDPQSTNNHHLYPNEMNDPSNHHYRSKPLSFDPTLPPDHIKVVSRTLFLGGVPMDMKEWDIATILKPYAEVQSVILNNQRKHAFVKVYSRGEAENILMNFNKDGSSPLRTRWGVGFGPRDCCDYQHGYSIIPMSRLTDADRKWSVSAQWGGTSGRPLQPGMVFEEPDIIVGEGVSSKAISQKMPTDSGRNGPKSNKGYPEEKIYPPNMNYPPPPSQMMLPVGGGPMPMNQMGGSNYPMYPPSDSMMPSGPPPPQQSQPQSFDPTAHLNSLMNMINQQQPQ